MGELDALLNLYDERATLECDCEHVRLTGRKWIAAYWAPKLESKAVLAFSLNDMALTADGVQVGCQDHEGKPLRMTSVSAPRARYSTQAAVHWDIAQPRKISFLDKRP